MSKYLHCLYDLSDPDKRYAVGRRDQGGSIYLESTTQISSKSLPTDDEHPRLAPHSVFGSRLEIEIEYGRPETKNK